MIETIKTTYEFNKVYNKGKSFANKYLVMYVYNNDRSGNRLGISVSKKVGNSVVRHRLARLIRECFRLNILVSNSGLDIVVIARAGAKGKGYEEIKNAYLHLIKLHGLKIKDSDDD